MTTKSRSRFQTLALVGIGALLVAFAIQQLGGVEFVNASESSTPAVPVALAGDVLLDEVIRVAPGAPVSIDIASEDVIIEQGEAGTVRFVIEGSTEAAREFFRDQNYRILDEDGGPVLRSRPDRRAERRRTYREGNTPTVRVWMPAGSAVSHDGTSGDVQIDKLDAASLSLDTGSGDLSLGEITTGRITIDTGSGDIRARGLRAESGRIDTGSGDVSLGRSSGDIEVDTGSGEIELGSHDGAFLADTGSGDVSMSARGATPVDVQTGSGDVTLALIGGELDVDTNGEVDIDASLNFTGRNQDGTARGRIGTGGPDVSVDCGSCDVSIRDAR